MKHTVKKLALCSLVGLFASQAYAHTSIRDQVDEGKPSYNAFNIGHGCGGDAGTDTYPVIGQTGLFPFGQNVVWRRLSLAGVELSKTIGGNGGILPDTATGGPGSGFLSLGVAGYDGFTSPYGKMHEIVDALGNVHALHWYQGAMNPKSNALTTFKVTAPMITDNCVRKLSVRMAALNWCDVQKNAINDIKGPYLAPRDAYNRLVPKVVQIGVNGGIQTNVIPGKYYTTMPKGNGDNNRYDAWFQNIEGGSANFSDTDLQSSWPAMVVNNVGVTPAQIAACPGGVQVDMIVEPLGVDFDTYLTAANMPGPSSSMTVDNGKPFPLGKSNF